MKSPVAITDKNSPKLGETKSTVKVVLLEYRESFLEPFLEGVLSHDPLGVRPI